MTDCKIAQQTFWQDFQDYALQNVPDYGKEFKKRQSAPQHWLDLSTGCAKYCIRLTVSSKSPKHIGVEIYIPKNKELFKSFESHKSDIEKELGFKLDWQPLEKKAASRIFTSLPKDYEDANYRQEIFNWLCTNAIKFKHVFKKNKN